MSDTIRTISHSEPFRVTDREEFMRLVDEDPDLAISEEEVDGQMLVRLWAETGHWPETGALVDLISPNLEEGEVAILQTTTIQGRDRSSFEVIGINSQGDSVEHNSTEFADIVREELGGTPRRVEQSEDDTLDTEGYVADESTAP